MSATSLLKVERVKFNLL